VSSPFAPTLGSHHDLPAAFREQFLLADGGRVRLEGSMNRIWRRHRWTWLLFVLLAQMNTLFPETGENVPATLTIYADADRHRWRRTFAFPRMRSLDSDMYWSSELSSVVERMGPMDAIEMVWQVRFSAPATIKITTVRSALRVAGRRVPLPDWLVPRVRAVEIAAPEADNKIAVDLSVTHPLLGPVFGYAGEFRLRRLDD
jgi:hypothetical protein